jgi:flagellar biosynthesis protein FlhB
MADDLGDRTEDATPKRRSEAREEGNVAKSHDLAGALMLLAITLALWATVMHMFGQGKVILGESLLNDALARPFDTTQAGEFASGLFLAALQIGAPLILLSWAAAALSHVVQIGWIFAPKAARPSFNKLNPLNGFKRIFGLSGLVKSSLDAVKVSVVIAIAVFSILNHASEIVVLPYLSPMEALGRTGEMMLQLALRVLAVLVVLGFLDFLYQRWKRQSDLKMTKQQVKDEMKQSEGDPEVKRRRMRIQRQIAMQRLSSAVPKADVIVTNPEHISIAIQYDVNAMGAPKVVAKGADYLALRIRQIAMQHGIPIIERKPLARALYKQVAVNQEIPPTFYKAVAEILAYVYRLNGKMAG